MATLHFQIDDSKLAWANVSLPLVVPMDMTLRDMRDALTGLGWRLGQVRDLMGRAFAHKIILVAEAKGEFHAPSPFTGPDEIVLDQLLMFATLRGAGFRVPWSDLDELRDSDYRITNDAEPAADDTAADDTAVEEDPADPQVPSTGSVPAVGDAKPPVRRPASGPKKS